MKFRHNDLTQRELDVLGLMCAGLVAKQIAARLNVSQRTVESHRAQVMHKSGCRNACQLGAWAARKELTERLAESVAQTEVVEWA